MFIKDKLYRHDCAKDLDLLVLKVSFVDNKRSKLRVMYMFRNGTSTNTIENVVIHKHEYPFWKEVKSEAV